MIRILAIALLAALIGVACASEPESTPQPVVEQPPPAPEPEPVAPLRPEPAAVTVADTPPPRELPKTASTLPLTGLAGALALGLAGGARVVRRSLLRRD